MTSTDDSIQLLARWKQGDEEAAEEIFSRYLQRLALLAGNRLSAKMRRRIDPQDVVQSAFRSFFHHAQNGRFELKRSGDLWRLLAAITVNKAMQHVEFHRAACRSIDSEEPITKSGRTVLNPEAYMHEPTVEEAAAIADELQAFMLQLEPLERKVFELRLQDHSSDVIAETIQRSKRTVRRILERIKSELTGRFDALSESGAE